jgi:hypothetical protein
MEKFCVNDVFSDEAMFHVSGTVIDHRMQIWDLENPRDIIECVKDSPLQIKIVFMKRLRAG